LIKKDFIAFEDVRDKNQKVDNNRMFSKNSIRLRRWAQLAY
jgi:hypothetical protein